MYALEPANDWEWFATSAPPPLQVGEARVGWLTDSDPTTAAEIVELLRTHSGRHDAEPGQEQVRRWCGSVTSTTGWWPWRPAPSPGRACRSSPRWSPGRTPAARASAPRSPPGSHVGLLADGSPRVTLGMYSDNVVARRIYLRLGFTCIHAFTGGRVIRVDR